MSPIRPFVFAALALAPFVRADITDGFSDAPRPLIRDGRFFGRIIVARNAPESERRTASYLADWILRVTGAKAEISEEEDAEKRAGVYVGETAATRRERISAPSSLSHDNAVMVVRPGGRLFLTGESTRATRYAAGRFVAENLGVMFLMPGTYGAEWNPLRIVRLPESDKVWAPRFTWRAITGLESEAEKTWALDVGLGESPAMNHALWDVFDAKAFAENPAMFPMRGGVRVPPSGRGGFEPQPNLANPVSARYAAGRAAAFFRKNPEAPTFSLSINDNMTWDDSPESKAALGAGKYFRNLPDYSDYVFGFMNRAAVALRERAPELKDRSLTAYAYYHCENTPSFRMDPDVFPVLTADRSHWRDPAFAAEDAALMDRWAASGVRNFGVYDYYYGIPMLAPRVFLKAESDSIRHAAAAGAKLFFAEMNPDWGFDGPKAWLVSELTRNPDLSPSRLLDRYFDTGYGPASGAMRRFFAEAEACWSESRLPPLWIRFYFDETVCELFPADARGRMRAALTEAERAFGRAGPLSRADDTRRERMLMRVRTVALSFAKFEALAESYELRRVLEAMPRAASFEDAAKLRKFTTASSDSVTRYLAAAAKWNSCPLNPGEPCLMSFYTTDAASVAAEKSGAFAGAPGDDVFAAMAAVLAPDPKPPVTTTVSERFDAASFRPAMPGAWSARRGFTIPRAPWRVTLFEGGAMRFGFDDGELLMAGGGMLKLTRDEPVAGGAMVGARIRHRGVILPGMQVALSLRFLDRTGAELPGGGMSQAMPSAEAAPRILAFARRAPEGAVRVEVELRVMGETAGDAMRFDDFEVRTLSHAR